MSFDLNTPQTQYILDRLLPIGTALLIFIVGWILSKWSYAFVLKALRSSRLDETVSRLIASIAQWVTIALTFAAALEKAGVETTSLAALFAAGGLAIGLALQGTLGNFASGMLLLVMRPFAIGDRVSAAGHYGDVEDIGIFYTTLSTPARENIILPNASVTSGSITNHTASGLICNPIDVGVAYGEDIDHVCELLLEAAAESNLVLTEPMPRTGLIEMASSSLNFRIICWSEPTKSIGMQVQIRTAIYNKLRSSGVEIPFNQLVVHRAGDGSEQNV